MQPVRARAFTLIELLIVVAIIAILAAIAIPNMLEAQVRSKVSRVKADQRSLATALEAYRVDYTGYILGPAKLTALGIPWSTQRDLGVRWRLVALTTPVGYMSSLPTTPFWTKRYRHSDGYLEFNYNLGSTYDTVGGPNTWYNNIGPMMAGARYNVTEWHLRDAGPDFTFNNQGPLETGDNVTNLMPYDPTNGTVSIGDIWRFGP